MEVTKDAIVKGVVKYAKAEVVNNIPDKTVRMVVAAAVKAIEMMPKLMDQVLDNPLVATFLHESNGMYNLDDAYEVLTSTMEEYGDFPLTIPVVKTPIVFNNRDVRALKDYIEGNMGS